MLVATSAWQLGGRRLESKLVLTPHLRAQLVRRDGMLYDSRLRIGTTERRGVATLYLVLSGQLEHAGVRHGAPCAWALREDEFELALGAGEVETFRSGGEPFVVLEICLPAERLRWAPGLALGPRPLPGDAWRAIDALAQAEGTRAIEGAFARVVDALVEAGALDAACAREPSEPEPPHLARVWEVVARFYGAQDTTVYLQAMADASRLSLRQTERDLGELARRFGLPGGFRDMLRTMRLRRALLLLSLEAPSVAEVARLVGYGSSDAFARAFRDAGLPSPTRARAMLRPDHG